jgi:hypothetical protein
VCGRRRRKVQPLIPAKAGIQQLGPRLRGDERKEEISRVPEWRLRSASLRRERAFLERQAQPLPDIDQGFGQRID